ncbi:MAG: TPM domain-containing protein [Candidatus Fimivivens sp.]|nr:TPM domain-containing protein [Candidatus Fimivivens sp.]
MMKHCQKLLKLPVIAILFVLLLQPCALAAESGAVEPNGDIYVSDLANVLSDEVEASINENSAALDALTGAQLVVVTVDFLGGESIRDYADDLFNRLQIGDADKNNGLLLLLATGEENYYALQGKGLEDALSDSSLETLLQQYLESDFAVENYEAGVQKTYAGLLGALEKLYGINDQGVLVAAANAKSAKIKIEKINKQKQGLLVAVGIVLLILLPAVLVASSASHAARRRKRR